MSIDKLQNPKVNQLVDTVNALIDQKQDVLTAGTNISIETIPPSEPVDTRSTASIVTVGSNRWQGVAYGNGVYVAVGNDGYTAYSSDGTNWSTPVQVGTNSWYSITFANGKFVSVGNTGYTTTTTDGQTWTTPTQISEVPDRLQQVRYGNGVFCAASWSNVTAASADGLTWTKSSNTGYRLGAVVYDGSQFVILGGISRGDGLIYTSPDGLTLTRTATISDLGNNPGAISYGNGVYIASNESGQVSYSTNLTSWSSLSQILRNIESIYYDGTQFIAVGRRAITSSSYKYSTITTTDGINWTTPVDIGDSASSSVITYGFLSITSNGNGKFVAVGDNGATTTFEITYEQEGGTVINGAEIVSTVDPTSTNSECVGAKLFYDTVGNIESALNTINSGSST